MPHIEKLKTLPFVEVTNMGKKFWTAKASGDWAADNTTGREYAAQLVRFMADEDSPNLLSSVVASMSMQPGADFTGVEIGFLTEIAERVIRQS